MKQTVQPNSQVPQSSAVESSSRSLRQTSADGHLAQLAATINQSSRVQAQLKLAEEMQGGAASQSHMAPAQRAPKKEKLAQKVGKPGEKKKPGQMQADSKKKQPPTQRQVNKKEKPRQMKFADSPAVAQLEEVPDTNRTGLPDQLKAGVESLSGLSLGDVKVHYNSGKPAQLNALAYGQGTDIHVAPGQEQHLPHEAWHIVQQKQGRVEPTMQMKVGVPVNDDPHLEREADVMGAKAVQRLGDSAAAPIASARTGAPHPLQRRDVPVVQAVLNIGKDYFDKDNLEALNATADKKITKKFEANAAKIKGNLTVMAEETKKEWDFTNWPNAIQAANGNQLPEPTRVLKKDIGELNPKTEEIQEKGSVNDIWQAEFKSLSEKYYPEEYEKIASKFKEEEDKSTTGANDAHQSLAQAAVHSARALAMRRALQQLLEGSEREELTGKKLPKMLVKAFTKKIENVEKKAKQRGETHHLI